MGKYRITAPVTYLEGKKVKHFTRARDEAVEIEDSVAKKLGDKVERVGASDDSSEDSADEKKTAASPKGGKAGN